MAQSPIKIDNDDVNILSALGFRYDLRVVAPFLWDRENIRRGIDDEIVKCASSETKCFRITEDSLAQILDLMLHTVNLLKQNIVSDDALVYLVDKERHEIVLKHDPLNASKNVLQTVSYPIELLKSVAAHVAFSKETVLSNDLANDKRFQYVANNLEVGHDIRSVICVPVLVFNCECYAVLELNRHHNHEFVQRDLDTLTVVSGWVGSTIEQHQKLLKIKRSETIEYKVSKILQSFISLQVDFDQSLHQVLEVAKDAIGAEQASFYLFENSTVTNPQMLTYDPALIDISADIVVLKKMRSNIDGLVKLTVDSDKCINIVNFAMDARVDPKLDSKSFLKLRSLLYIPIMDPSGCPLGVMQMINKIIDDGVFNSQDELTLQSFRSCLVNMLKFQSQLDLQSKALCNNALCEDVMLNRIPMHIVLTPTVPPSIADTISWPDNFTSYHWHPTVMNTQHELVNLAFKMLTTVCCNKLLEPNTMYIFLITVKEMHRPHPFHNFEKSFSSMHGVFCILSRIKDKFDPIERLSMMLASLCVGLDHSGSSNAFLRLSKNPLSKIYTSSYNQNHIVWMAKIIIANTRVLHLLSAAQKEAFDEYFREQILCTDIHAFTLRQSLQLNWFRERTIDWSCGNDRRMLRILITICTYLPHLYKTFRLSRKLLNNYIQQMWSEGDKVAAFGIQPTPYYDRKYNQIARINMDMLRIVGVSCFKEIQELIPETADMHANCMKVITAWEQTLENTKQRTWFPDKSISGSFM